MKVELILDEDDLIERLALKVAELVESRHERSPLLDVDEAAAYLRCNRKRIYDLCSQGRLAHEKDGSRTLIRREQLDRHLKRIEANIPDGDWQ